MIRKVLSTLAALAFTGTAAIAGAKDGPSLRNGGLETVYRGPILSYTPADLSDPGSVKIFDNLASKDPKGIYWASLGATITGPQGAQGFPEYWAATAFTPSGDHTIIRIKVALAWIRGTNSVVVSLNADSKGLPGPAIESWHVSGLPKFLSCCELQTITEAKGIQVTGGTQYWMVVSTDGTDPDLWGGANINVTDEIDPAVTASYCSQDNGGTCTNKNDGWTLQTGILPGFAFAVLGSH